MVHRMAKTGNSHSGAARRRWGQAGRADVRHRGTCGPLDRSRGRDHQADRSGAVGGAGRRVRTGRLGAERRSPLQSAQSTDGKVPASSAEHSISSRRTPCAATTTNIGCHRCADVPHGVDRGAPAELRHEILGLRQLRRVAVVDRENQRGKVDAWRARHVGRGLLGTDSHAWPLHHGSQHGEGVLRPGP